MMDFIFFKCFILISQDQKMCIYCGLCLDEHNLVVVMFISEKNKKRSLFHQQITTF